MRGELLRFSNGAAADHDSYNSSPAALHAMIKVLAATPNYIAAGFSRREKMRELGATDVGRNSITRQAKFLRAQTGKIDLGHPGVEGDAAADRGRSR